MLGLGLRPRLKVRPSLLDLLSHNKTFIDLVDSAAEATTASPPLDHLPPLPATPTPTSTTTSSTFINDQDSPSSPTYTPTPSADNLPAEIIVELQLPASPPSPSPPPVMAPSDKKQNDDEQLGAVFSISGPVVVAEKMIGCAMYELVSFLTLTFASF
jgi:V-type H+-transporting ATPase subunit A